MKRVMLSIALVSGLSLASMAQTNNPSGGESYAREQRNNMTPNERAVKDANWAEKKLGLNADQKSKWQAASLERANANQLLKEKMRGSTTPEEREQIRNNMKKNNDTFDATVNGFLTPDQKAKYEQEKTQRHGMHKGGKGHHDDSGN